MEADYVIVGAGSAGCALAYRLAEAGRDVLVVEHGGTDAGPFIQMPGALSYPMNMARYDWGLRTEPEPGLGGRRLAVPRGKVVGGSSSINGMVYVRGHPQDFDAWEDAGACGWSHADVAPYFRRMEHWHGDDPHGARGHDGPLHVTPNPQSTPLGRAFIDAGVSAGFGETADYNGARQEGCAVMQSTIWQGRRWSAANAYLHPALKRPNCRLARGFVRRVLIRDGRAEGIEVGSSAHVRTIRARREVILAASSLNSPKLLMLSGIGPAAHLAEHGIAVIADRPGVGANLQDHLEVYVQTRCTAPVSLYPHWSLTGKARVGTQWMLGRRGLGATNGFEAVAFLRSAPDVAYPDVQFHFLPIAVRYDGSAAVDGHGFQIHTGPMRSPSRGTVRLASSDPAADPAIRFNYMSTEQDWTDFRRAVRMVRELLDQPAFAAYRGAEVTPGDDATSDDAIDAFIRDEAESAYHPCGTCRMGAADDPDAVVDPEGRVIGVDGLRVADSSVFPLITNGNTNAPSILVGEKVADHILGRALAPDELARAAE